MQKSLELHDIKIRKESTFSQQRYQKAALEGRIFDVGVNEWMDRMLINMDNKKNFLVGSRMSKDMRIEELRKN